MLAGVDVLHVPPPAPSRHQPSAECSGLQEKSECLKGPWVIYADSYIFPSPLRPRLLKEFHVLNRHRYRNISAQTWTSIKPKSFSKEKQLIPASYSDTLHLHPSPRHCHFLCLYPLFMRFLSWRRADLSVPRLSGAPGRSRKGGKRHDRQDDGQF